MIIKNVKINKIFKNKKKNTPSRKHIINLIRFNNIPEWFYDTHTNSLTFLPSKSGA
jgi:hypothetical protein